MPICVMLAGCFILIATGRAGLPGSTVGVYLVENDTTGSLQLAIRYFDIYIQEGDTKSSRQRLRFDWRMFRSISRIARGTTS